MVQLCSFTDSAIRAYRNRVKEKIANAWLDHLLAKKPELLRV